MKPMIQAHLVERDQFGFWTHPNYPDLADNCSSNEAQETLRRLGLELQTVFMESDAPRLYDSARSDQRYSEWIPTRPEGSGWFVLSIHDTDNGPVCQYVRPLGEHLSPIDLDAAAEQHERLLSEACAKALNQRDAALARVASLESKLEELEKLEPAAPSDPKLKPCPLCGSTNIRMLEPELLDTNAWNCAIECLDCQVYIGPSYCEPDTVTARYSAQVDWNRRPSAKSHADEREQFLMANLLAALEVALGNVAALAIVDRVRQVADRIYPTSSLSPVPQAWLDVQAERRRQIEAEGWTPEHDDEHSHGQMARAAACYALAGSSAPNDGTAALLVSLAWPWDEQWWKPTTVRRDLVKACALTLAEIERLDRTAPVQSSTCCKGDA
ncbi:hypothetical protein [Pseudomonas aeruginosa]|uniref:hypothetical protein n=1 Tax=Pseudomonas aeruginosa TaxID=287 RepID=UPI00224CCC28|nr:hypothetical protein [Pseudomonas aeruginosa]MCX4212234.1 hypothetical protein [Pseudomonas aeruginosa]MCX4231082.1 hypothetical protein [Pseudomonas aeruginosa]